MIINRVLRRVAGILRKEFRLIEAKKLGFIYEPPNFIFFPKFSKDSVVIDAGCSYEADFSKYMIKNYGVRSYGIDPTLKHKAKLEKLENELRGNFFHLPYAVGVENSKVLFHESKVNESGSLLADHINVKNDEIISYEVEVVSLKTILTKHRIGNVEFLKLDLEGAEYDLFNKISKDDICIFPQIFIEFHHHAVSNYTYEDTQRIVTKMQAFGYQSFSLDNHNYLFYFKNILNIDK